MKRILLNSFFRLLPAAIVLLSMWASPLCRAQQDDAENPQEEEPPKRIIEREPFDLVTLNDKGNNAGAELTVEPISFPGRTPPEKPKQNDKLKLNVLSITGLEEDQTYEKPKVFEVAWKHIEKIDLYEVMVLREADELAAVGENDPDSSKQAYEYFQFLLLRYPKTPGLATSLQSYLFLEARGLAKKQQYRAALAILEELHSKNAGFTYGNTTLAAALGRVFDIMIGQYVEQDQLKPARALLARVVATYGESQKEIISKWQTELDSRAKIEQTKARQHLAANRVLEAHRAVRRMLDLWPAVDGGRELALQIFQQYPQVVVGVTQPGNQGDMLRIDYRAARRIGRLTAPTMFDFLGYGPERGRYESRLGAMRVDEEGTRITFDLSELQGPAALSEATGYDLSRLLLELADPRHAGYQPAWSALLRGVQVEDVHRVHVDLRHRQESPEALLRFPLASLRKPAPGPIGTHIIGDGDKKKIQLIGNPQRKLTGERQRTQVVEVHYDDPLRAVDALRRGEIDLVDRLFPADAARLRGGGSLVVGAYALPTVHVLVPNQKNPFLANRNFRRALVYGIHRELILKRDLLRGGQLPECRLVSGPFPTQIAENEVLGIAYDETIEPLPYEPALAFTLIELAKEQIVAVAKQRKEEPPKLKPLVLGHPAEREARVACQAIVEQLGKVGIGCRLKELPLGVVDDPQGKCDLLYAELAVWEPIVDAGRLFGTRGVAPAQSAYVRLALRQVEEARSLRDVRDGLRLLHRRVHDQVSVIPLWQMPNYFAHRRDLTGVANRPVYLYQQLDRWRLTPRLAAQSK